MYISQFHTTDDLRVKCPLRTESYIQSKRGNKNACGTSMSPHSLDLGPARLTFPNFLLEALPKSRNIITLNSLNSPLFFHQRPSDAPIPPASPPHPLPNPKTSHPHHHLPLLSKMAPPPHPHRSLHRNIPRPRLHPRAPILDSRANRSLHPPRHRQMVHLHPCPSQDQQR